MEDAFAALSDPTRRAILHVLAAGRLSAGEIACRFDQQRPAISKHLTILKRAGLLAEARDRQRRLYSIRCEGFEDLLRLITTLRAGPIARPASIASAARAEIEEVETAGDLPAAGPRLELDFD
jgi:DNA-binding transcriptional ArsR family regulator